MHVNHASPQQPLTSETPITIQSQIHLQHKQLFKLGHITCKSMLSQCSAQVMQQKNVAQCSTMYLAKHKSKGDLTSSESESASIPEKVGLPSVCDWGVSLDMGLEGS